MKKLTVLTTGNDADAVVRKLMRLRCVEISQSVPDTDVGISPNIAPEEKRVALEKSITRISQAIAVLTPYSHRKKGLGKPLHKIGGGDEFVGGPRYNDARKLVDGVLSTQSALADCHAALLKNGETLDALNPWIDYDLPLSEDSTQRTEILLGSFPFKLCIEDAEDAADALGACLEIVSSDPDLGAIYASVCYLRESREDVLKWLNGAGFVKANFKDLAEEDDASEAVIPARRVALLREGRLKLEGEEERLKNELRDAAEKLDEIEILYDVEATALNAAKQQLKLGATECCRLLSGWVPAKKEDAVAKVLDTFECAWEMTDPEEGDDPPVLLENNWFARNFEWVLGMYSYPQYGRYDPTFIMSLFYFVIFGLMFADVGYGLILMIAGFGGAKLLKPREGMKRFLLMFGWCGISCTVMGVLFGSYFGDLPLAIMKNMMGIAEADLPNLALIRGDSPTLAILMDPLSNPMGFLVISLAIGGVHLIAGMAVKFCILCKDGHPLDAICDIGFYWVLFAGIGVFALGYGWYVLAAGAGLIVLTHGRAEKNIVKKLVKGLLGLYDLVSYASDLLSYSRILALGLAAGVVGQVVNIMATMGGPSVPGFIILVIAFLVGHALNLALNVLGTFVHTARLQYIEFFGKFYEDGGRPFRAAVPSDKYTTD